MPTNNMTLKMRLFLLILPFVTITSISAACQHGHVHSKHGVPLDSIRPSDPSILADKKTATLIEEDQLQY